MTKTVATLVAAPTCTKQISWKRRKIGDTLISYSELQNF